MKPKTKAQELGLLSRDFAVAKDKKNWLALFDDNAIVQDPIGKSPLDPEGNGHQGIDAIEKFLSVGSVWKFQKYYEDSFILQFYWENDFVMEEIPQYTIDKKISFLLLIKKYFSKKVRTLISKVKR